MYQNWPGIDKQGSLTAFSRLIDEAAYIGGNKTLWPNIWRSRLQVLSLGSYEAGVLYGLMEVIRTHNLASNEEENIYVDVTTGASAGGMTAAIVAQRLMYDDKVLPIRLLHRRSPPNGQHPQLGRRTSNVLWSTQVV